jgi:hypothetical protein
VGGKAEIPDLKAVLGHWLQRGGALFVDYSF